MNKKILFIALICLCVFMAGCSNNVATGASGTVQNNIMTNVENKNITQAGALNMVSKMVGTLPKGYRLDYDHLQTVANKGYYVMHLYEVVVDNEQAGASHTISYEWFYVDKVTGTVYTLDVPNNSLIKVNNTSNSSYKMRVI